MELPVYESNATAEDRQENLEKYAKQFRLIRDQEKIGTPIRNVKIRCGCLRLVTWYNMYRCLYCGIWFCQECAEQHFGDKKPKPLSFAESA